MDITVKIVGRGPPGEPSDTPCVSVSNATELLAVVDAQKVKGKRCRRLESNAIASAFGNSLDGCPLGRNWLTLSAYLRTAGVTRCDPGHCTK